MAQGADSLDQATDLAMATNESHVNVARRAAERATAPEQTQNPDGTWPVTECDCGAPLGGRAALGKIRCVRCQSELEKRNKLWAKS